MGGEVKQTEIKNRTYYLYNNLINLENFEKLVKNRQNALQRD